MELADEYLTRSNSLDGELREFEVYPRECVCTVYSYGFMGQIGFLKTTISLKIGRQKRSK